MEVIIVGSGPAGVTLAIYLKRSNVNVSVFTTHNSMLKKAQTIENYYGLETIRGDDLYDRGIEQLKKLNIPIIEEEVIRIEKDESFTVYTEKNKYRAKVVVLANGIVRTSSNIPMTQAYEGKGVSYCATCDGFFFRNKPIVVVGSGSFAYEEVKHLSKITNDITLLTNGQELTRSFNDLGVSVFENRIKAIEGDSSVERVILDDERNIECNGIFIASGIASSLNFSKALGISMNGNYIKVNDQYMTNVDGLYAIGDAIGGILQIGKAVSDGILASKHIINKLKEVS